MKKILLALALAALAAAPVKAQSFCDTQTTGMLLPVPDFDTPGYQWFTCMNSAFIHLNSSATVLGTGTTGYMLRMLVDSIGALSATEISFTSNVASGS